MERLFALIWFIFLIDCKYCHGHGIVPKLTHDKVNQCLSKGTTVTFTCDFGDSSSDWLFLWYKVVPLRDGLPAHTHWSGRSTYSLELLSESSRGPGGSYTLNSTNLEHVGYYVCRAKKEKPLFYTDYSKPVFLWINDPDSAGCLSINPNRTKYVQSESLSLVCRGNGTGWTLRRITDYMEMSQCPFITGTSSWENGTCHISAVSQYDSGVYWCQTESGQFSNGLFIEVHNHDVRVYIKCESGTWMTEGQQFEIGDSVKLLCVVEGSSIDWRFLWYRLVPHRDGLPEAPRWNSDPRYSLELLLDSNTQADGTYTLNAAGPEHSGLYVCGVERGEPAYYIYSSPKLIWVKDSSPPALLNLSPNRTHFFENESVSFTCEVPGNVSGWILRTYRNHQVPMDLPLELDSQGKAAFNIKSLNASHSGAYWCQTESGELSNIINIRVDRHGIVPKLTHDKANECPSKGATVTFTCDIGDSSSDWLFLWYRVVPLRDGLPADTHWSGRSTYSLELLSESSRGAGGSYTLNSANLEHFGLYVCRAKKEKPLFYTDYSKPMFLWVNDPESGRMSVSPNRTKYFQSESLSLVCGENRTGWTLRRITNYIEMSQCPFITGTSSWENGTCHISAVSQYDSGVYWCQSASGEFSNGLYIEVQNVRVSIKCKSGTWMNEGQQFEIGDSVELHCVVEGSSVDLRFLWYRLVPHRDGLPEAPRWNSDSRYSLELLLDSNTQADGTYTLNAAGPEHSGFYVCGVERGEPAYYIYSSPKLIWVKDSSPPALLNLSPNRTHFFKNESVSFTCEVPGNVSGWILRKYRNHQVPMDLPLELDSQGKAAFNIKSLNASHSGAYWCQTESGELSNIINIRVDNRPDPYIYVTPKDWLTAGDSVSLHCKIHKSYTSDTSWRILWYKIVSYKEELLNFTDEYSGSKYSLKLLSDSNSAAGSSYTFSSVHPEHSGLYVCRGEREQPVYHAAYSKPQLLWVKDASPKASLTISSNRTQYFPLDSLSLSCVVQGKASGWSLRRLTDSYPRSISDCPFNNTATWNHSTCNISSLGVSDSGVYWCQSESGQHSNAVKIKVNYDPHPVLHVSPSTWPAKGDTVTLKCEVSGSESGWTFLFYKVIAPIDEVLTESVQLKISETSTELLSQSSREAGASYTLTSVSPEHTGFYVCRAQRNNSSYHTPYSYLSHLWVIDPSPPAFLSIYPNSSVFFEYESLSMTCKIKGNSSGWTLRKFTNYNKASHCAFKHESVTWDEMPCTLRFLRIADGGHYWCQSESGEYSNAVNISVYGKPNVFLKVSPNHWVAEGASLKLTCMVFPFLTSGWIFLWYRVVASGEGMPIKTVPPHKEFSVQPLSDSDSESTGSYNQSSVGPQHSGIYVCRAKRKDSDYYTDYSQPQPVWVTSPSPSAWLSLTPNRTEYLVSQSLSLSCEVFGNTTGWMVRRYTSIEGLSDCPFGVRSGSWAESTCNISSLSTYDSGVYWCQSTSGELSNPVKTTVHMPGTIYSYVTVSPNQWVNEGSPVTLSCSVTTPSPGQRFQWYKAVPVRKGLPLVHSQSREAKYSVELLSDSSRGAGGSYTLSSVASEHSGLYVCRAEIEDLDTYTEYSQPQILTVTGYSPSAWLNVTPSRSQHFVSEPLTLSCKTKDSTTGWAVRRFTSWKELSDCPFNKKSEFMDSSTCNISSLTLSDSGVYWCQSESGKRSNAVNITVHTGKVLLESPVHPLREGEQVTLRCSNRKNLKSNLSATFYKDGLLVQNRTSAIMTILNVSKRDEGLYNCENEEKRRSPRSWVSVRAAHGESQGPHKRLRTMYQRFKDIL